MADWEEAAGISAPLYEIVDTVFELQSRGFFRRQVTWLFLACGPCTPRGLHGVRGEGCMPHAMYGPSQQMHPVE